MVSALICKRGMLSFVCRRLKMVVTSSRGLQHRVPHWYQQVGTLHSGTTQSTCWDLRTEGKYESVPLHGLQETIPRNPSRLTSLMGRLVLDQAVSRRPAAQHSSLLTPLMSTMSQRCSGPCCSQHIPARHTNTEWKHIQSISGKMATIQPLYQL